MASKQSAAWPRTTMDEPKPWEQLPKETEKAYGAFLIFRNLPLAERTLPQAWRVHTNWEEGKPKTQVAGSWTRWHVQHQWEARAAAWDAHINRTFEEAAEERAAELGINWAERAERHREDLWLQCQRGLKRVEEMLKRPLAEGSNTPWTLQACAIAMSTFDRIGRLACGMETDRKASEVSGPGGAPVQVENTYAPRHDLLTKDPEQMTDDELRAAAATAVFDNATRQALAVLSGGAPGAPGADRVPGGPDAPAAAAEA